MWVNNSVLLGIRVKLLRKYEVIELQYNLQKPSKSSKSLLTVLFKIHTIYITINH